MMGRAAKVEKCTSMSEPVDFRTTIDGLFALVIWT